MTTTLLEQLTHLQAALDELAVALRAADADAVLSAEEPLASAISALAPLRGADIQEADRFAVRRALTTLRLTLARCEALGSTADGLGRAMMPPVAYDRAGLRSPLSGGSDRRSPVR